MNFLILVREKKRTERHNVDYNHFSLVYIMYVVTAASHSIINSQSQSTTQAGYPANNITIDIIARFPQYILNITLLRSNCELVLISEITILKCLFKLKQKQKQNNQTNKSPSPVFYATSSNFNLSTQQNFLSINNKVETSDLILYTEYVYLFFRVGPMRSHHSPHRSVTNRRSWILVRQTETMPRVVITVTKYIEQWPS
uniref:Uncharacterized protein n=1 Tax=Glossina pallidipes TaxID=7398 RepID=A0A1B0ACP1_GLOPL